MRLDRDTKLGYVLKAYPRLSETFVLNEILAHERAGAALEIFSLRPPADGRFHEALARVRAPVTYLPSQPPSAADLWGELSALSVEGQLPHLLRSGREEKARDVYQALVLARLARARGVGHLHAHFATLATTVARLAADVGGLTYSFTAHAKDIFHDTVEPDDLRSKLRGAASVITVSDHNARHLRGLEPPAASRVHRVYNGVELARYPYSSPLSRPPEVAAVGRLVEKKGFADLVEACAILARRGVTFRCSIAGAGVLETELREHVTRLGLDDRVDLVGPLTQEEVRRLVQGAAVLAAPSVIARDGNREGLPTVLIEAMALGTPCVSTDVTGIPEVVRDGESGLLVGEHDPEALAAALERLLIDGRLRVRLAGSARRLVESRFDVDRNSARIRELLSPVTVGELDGGRLADRVPVC